MDDEVAATRLGIRSKGEELRALKADPSQAAAAAACLAELLALKERFRELTGTEHRKRTKRAADDDGGGGKRQKQPPLPKASAEEEWPEPADPLELPPAASTFPAWEPRSFFGFEVVHRSRKPGSRARVGRIRTPHGVIETPAFVPVGTNAALKALDERHSRDAGTQLTFCNTYHLLVHPGPEIVRRAGGLHAFMNHAGPLITDSGGFQVFSLGAPSADDGPEMKRRNASARRSKREPKGAAAPPATAAAPAAAGSSGGGGGGDGDGNGSRGNCGRNWEHRSIKIVRTDSAQRFRGILARVAHTCRLPAVFPSSRAASTSACVADSGAGGGNGGGGDLYGVTVPSFSQMPSIVFPPATCRCTSALHGGCGPGVQQ